MDTEWAAVAGIASAVSAIVLVVAAIVASKQLREARQLRLAQTRPFVVVDFDAQSMPPAINLEIANVGLTMARNVTFAFAPELQSSFDESGPLGKFADLNILRRGIPSLVPGKKIALLFDSSIARRDLVNTYSVTIRYEGERGHVYSDVVALDLDIYWNVGRIDRRGLHDVHERLKEIRQELKRWSASGRGLLVLSPEDVQRREEEWLRAMRESEPGSPPHAADP